MRILGITIPDGKQLQYALTEVYGIGLSRSQAILDATGIDRTRSAESLSTEEENKIRTEAEAFTLEGTLRREVDQNIKRLKDTGSYRGKRHKNGLPSRGQRTKTNSRTTRGNKRNTMGSGRVKVSKT